MTDHVRYDLLVQDALRGVVRRVLTDAARDGLQGDHHFYVSFRTDKPGVRVSARLRERYPQDMTIVLQHQFDALTVQEQAFEVGLSFSGVPERLRVPFDALTGFFDPSVQFGLKFEAQADEEAPAEGSAPVSLPAPVAKIGAPKKPSTGQDEKAPAEATKKPGKRKREEAEPSEPAPEPSGEVVSLDAFRKKS